MSGFCCTNQWILTKMPHSVNVHMSLCISHQFVETISSKQTELDTFIAEGYKTALSEERRRYCFLVDRQCAVAKNSSAYHGKVSPSVTR